MDYVQADLIAFFPPKEKLVSELCHVVIKYKTS